MRWWLLLTFLLTAVGCECAPPPNSGCADDGECGADQMCVDGTCQARVGFDAFVPEVDGGSMMCAPTERPCRGSCCAEGEVCGRNGGCCERSELCGAECCGAGEVCEGAICRLDCGSNVRCEDEEGAEVCCSEGEVCASGGCFLADRTCRDFIDCEAGEYCEPSLGRCLPQPSGEECVAVPVGGEVRPTLLWHWDGTGAELPDHKQVMMAPMVANLNDDNGDGVADENDIPDVVFNTFAGGSYGSNGVLRAVSGADGSSIFDVTDPDLRTNAGAQVAIGDIDGDGWNEIVTCASSSDGLGPLIAFNHDGTLLWRADDAPHVCGQAAPAIADLDGDGQPEVFVRYTVLDGATGALKWHKECQGTGGWATDAHSPCDYTTAADLDLDGKLEIVGGNVAYRADGSVFFDRTADFNDGYPAIGDLDLDGRPEIVVVHSAFYPSPYGGDHWLRALNWDGTDRWGPIDLNAGHAPSDQVASGNVGGGGPPTIANFDDDPEPEIAAAGAFAYAVFEPDGSLRWASPTDDASSRKTGSSVFDFDGDGIAEVVYGDHYWLRVYDGRDGHVRFCLCNTTATLWEYPVIVDVNNDGHAEIVIASNNYGDSYQTCPMRDHLGECERDRIAAGEDQGTNGIRVFASPSRDWVGTRRIWNQHTYHVTNVSERGEIPRHQRPNWTIPGLNNFRLNVQPGATNLPDLAPIDLAVDLTRCSAQMLLNFRVQNQGWSAAPADVPVGVYADPDGSGFQLLERVSTTRALLPGEAEALSVTYELPPGDADLQVRFRVVVNDGGDPSPAPITECRPDNNAAEITGDCAILL